MQKNVYIKFILILLVDLLFTTGCGAPGVTFIKWSPRGDKIAFLVSEVEEGKIDPYAEAELWLLESGKPHTKCKFEEVSVKGNYLFWSPDGKSIAFASDEEGSWDIWVQNIPKGIVQLTTHLAKDCFPAYSPNGKKVVFTSYKNGNADIWIMDVDGKNKIALTKSETKEVFPIWAPNGSKIAFITCQNGNLDIWIINPDGGEKKQLTTHPAKDYSPCWSPDSKKIVFVSERSGNLDIWIMNADGSDKRQLTSHDAEDRDPLWLPKKGKILFVSKKRGNTDIWIMKSDGRKKKALTENHTRDDNPSWSPDGRRIIYGIAQEGEGNLELFRIMSAKGRGKIWLIATDKDWLTLGDYYRSNNRYRKALHSYKKVESDSAYQRLANLYLYELKNYRKALREYRKILELNPQAEVHDEMGRIYNYYLLDFEKAIQEYQKALKPSQKSSPFYKNIQKQIDFIKNNLDEKQKPLRLYCFAYRLSQEGKFQRALEKFNKIVEKYPKSNLAANAQYEIGNIYFNKLGNYEQSLAAHQKLRRNYPNSPLIADMFYKMGEVYAKLGKYDQGAEIWLTLWEKYPESDSAKELEEILELYWEEAPDPEIDQLVATFAKLTIKKYPKNRKGLLSYQALIGYKMGQDEWREAIKLLEKIRLLGEENPELISSDPEDREEYFYQRELMVAFCYEQLGRWNEAIDVYQRISKKSGEDSFFKERIELLKNSISNGEALKWYLEAERTAWEDPLKAVEEFQKIINKYPQSFIAIKARCQIAEYSLYEKPNNLIEYNQAIQTYKKIVDSYPKEKIAQEAQFAIGDCYRKQENYLLAIKSYQELLQKFPEGEKAAEAQFNIGTMYKKLKKHEQALKAFQTLVEKYPESKRVEDAQENIEKIKR